MSLLPPVLVTDTNIWIDLENGGILDEVFRLPYRFVVPDFAIKELAHPRWEILEERGLEAHELPAELVRELAELVPVHRDLSVVDLSAFVLARLLAAMLITGDRRLKALSASSGIEVHGVLWVLDEMVGIATIDPARAAAALGRMLDSGARLPAAACETRIRDWSE